MFFNSTTQTEKITSNIATMKWHSDLLSHPSESSKANYFSPCFGKYHVNTWVKCLYIEKEKSPAVAVWNVSMIFLITSVFLIMFLNINMKIADKADCTNHIIWNMYGFNPIKTEDRQARGKINRTHTCLPNHPLVEPNN